MVSIKSFHVALIDTEDECKDAAEALTSSLMATCENFHT